MTEVREQSVAKIVTMSVDTLRVDLNDGPSISVPLRWYPRLLHASLEERSAGGRSATVRHSLGGTGRIHWRRVAACGAAIG